MKKIAVIVPVALVAVTALGIFVPKAYQTIKENQRSKEIEEEYQAYLADNKTFFDNSFFNDVDISGLTPDEALVKVEKEFEGKTLLIKDAADGEEDTLKYDKFDVDYKNLLKEVLTAYEGQTLSKEEYMHGAAKKEYSYNIASDVNFSKLDTKDLSFFDESTRIKSVDAHYSVDKVTKAFSIIDEVYGNEIREDAFIKKVEASVLAGDAEVMLDSEDHVLPEILSSDAKLNDTKKYYEKLLNKTLNLEVCLLAITLEPEKTLELLDFEAGDEADTEAIEAYVNQLKHSYDTYMTTRVFATSTGEIVNVAEGDYGWRIDADATVEAIKTALLSDKEEDSALAVYTVQGQRPATNEISNTYVEIDLRDQKIWMYVDGIQVANDDITSGMVGVPEALTRTGTFSLLYKTTNVVLKGPTWNDFVFYWMPYDIPYAVGMHDATWRTDDRFGGDVRYTDGSHGCVNLRLGTAGVIYNYIQMDTPIIVWE